MLLLSMDIPKNGTGAKGCSEMTWRDYKNGCGEGEKEEKIGGGRLRRVEKEGGRVHGKQPVVFARSIHETLSQVECGTGGKLRRVWKGILWQKMMLRGEEIKKETKALL